MKIALLSIGTRGDMEPFLAIGALLKKRGHQVRAIFPEQFAELAHNLGIEFSSLGPEFINMLDSEEGKDALGGGGSWFRKTRAYVRLARNSTEINKQLVFRQRDIIDGENPDRIVHNAKAMYPVLWGIQNPDQNILVSPIPYIHPVKDRAHIAFNGNYGRILNRMTYALSDFGVITTLMMSQKWLELEPRFSRSKVKRAYRDTRAIYTVSNELFERPAYWPDSLQVLGYYERDKVAGWDPDPEVLQLLDIHPKVILVTFGSMTNPEPEQKSRMILDVLEKNGVPAIVNSSVGGLERPEGFHSELIHFVSDIPYDWLFPKIYGVVHHGGSGTTHMALKYGCASLIIPHIIDQFLWNDLVANLGAGPKGVPIGKLTEQRFEQLLKDLMENPIYKQKAKSTAAKMAGEDKSEQLCQTIEAPPRVESAREDPL